MGFIINKTLCRCCAVTALVVAAVMVTGAPVAMADQAYNNAMRECVLQMSKTPGYGKDTAQSMIDSCLQQRGVGPGSAPAAPPAVTRMGADVPTGARGSIGQVYDPERVRDAIQGLQGRRSHQASEGPDNDAETTYQGWAGSQAPPASSRRGKYYLPSDSGDDSPRRSSGPIFLNR